MMNYINNDDWLNQNDLLPNSLSLFSSAIGLQNLEENRFQAQQTQFLLEAIAKQSKDLDARLDRIENTLQLLLDKLDP